MFIEMFMSTFYGFVAGVVGSYVCKMVITTIQNNNNYGFTNNN